jgi:hypothetical protein
MTLTLRDQECKIGQFSDIISIMERGFCRILERRYVEVRAKFSSRDRNLHNLTPYPSNCSHLLGIAEKRLTVHRAIYLAGFAESDIHGLDCTRFS